MEYKRCACGCGKIIADPTNSQKFYNKSHRRRYNYLKSKAIPEKPIVEKKIKRKTTPEQRWQKMSWEEITAEGLRLHKTYGQLQSMYYNGTLPDDFGI